jgi:hypothetical protein
MLQRLIRARVGKVSVGKTSSVFVIDATRVSWESAFHSLSVRMYQTSESHTLRPHGKPKKRGDAVQIVSTATGNQFTYAIPKPTATPAANVSTLDVAGQLLDTPLFSLASSSLQVSCKNCSTFGKLDASFVSFNWTKGAIHGGEFELVAHGMGAHVELLTNITGDAVIEVPLFKVPLIAGIAVSTLTFCFRAVIGRVTESTDPWIRSRWSLIRAASARRLQDQRFIVSGT